MFFFLLLFCQERENSNPFDPDFKDSVLNIDLTLREVNSSVLISWQIPQYPDYISAEIYKSANGMDFSLLASVAKSINSVVDSNITEEIKNTYFLKLIGNNVESKPTRHFSITTGPGDIWITDSFLAEILHLNYDLENSSVRKSSIWIANDLSIAKSINRGLIIYPRNRQIEIFNTKSGLTRYQNFSIPYPFDAVYDSNLDLFWLIDSSGTLYQVDTTAIAIPVTSQFLRPVQIDVNENTLIILDSKNNQIHLYNSLFDTTKNISQNALNEDFKNLKLFRLDKIHGSIYFLDAAAGNMSTIYKYQIDSETLTPVITDSLILTFDINSQDESIWIVTSKGLNFELVQLSNSGQRLLSVPKTFIEPRDVKVNPYNGNVIITDFIKEAAVNTDKVFHYKATELVGTFRTYGDPFKVYIE